MSLPPKLVGSPNRDSKLFLMLSVIIVTFFRKLKRLTQKDELVVGSTFTKGRGMKMWIPMVTYIILTKKKRSKTARAINRLLKLLLKLRLRSTFLSLTLVADFEQEDRTVPEEAHPDDFARSARTSYITFDPVHLSRANNPDNLYSLINHHRTMSDHSYDNY